MKLFRMLFAVLAVVALFAIVAGDADARPRFSVGSRGTRTWSAPAPTATAPNAANPITRSMTQPGQGGIDGLRPSMQPGAFGFGRGLAGGLLGGLLGAGLFGMLFGGGFFGGIAGFASFLGLALQIGLIAIVGTMLWRWWQRRAQPQTAYAGVPGDIGAPAASRSALNALGFAGTSASAPLQIARDDLNAFERALGEIQNAYGHEDLAALRAQVTPEMLSYYAEELSANASRGVVNRISDVKLLQGDVAEAWREGEKEYATVAMRYALTDRYLARATGRLLDGSDEPQQATEVWTFMRRRGGNWLLSAIQQA